MQHIQTHSIIFKIPTRKCGRPTDDAALSAKCTCKRCLVFSRQPTVNLHNDHFLSVHSKDLTATSINGICVLPTVTYLPYRFSASTLTAVGRSQLLARWPGTHSLILSGIRRAAQTVLGVYLKRTVRALLLHPAH